MERLQKIIAMKGYCSRRKEEELMREIVAYEEYVNELGGKTK